MSTHAKLQTSRRQLLLQHRQLLPLLLRQRETRTSTVLDHLLHQPRLLRRELPPRGLDVPLGGLLRAEDVEAHGRLDGVVVQERLRFRRRVAHLLRRGDILVEGQGVRGEFEDRVGLSNGIEDLDEVRCVSTVVIYALL